MANLSRYHHISNNDLDYMKRREILKHIILKFIAFLNSKSQVLAAGYHDYKHYRRYSGAGGLTDYWYLTDDYGSMLHVEFIKNMGRMTIPGLIHRDKEYYLHGFFMNICGDNENNIINHRIIPFIKKYLPHLEMNNYYSTITCHRNLFTIRIATKLPLQGKEYRPYSIIDNLWDNIAEYIDIKPLIDVVKNYDDKDLCILTILDNRNSNFNTGDFLWYYKGFDIKQFTLFDLFLQYFMHDPKDL